jgi:SAM-dependent methyltransferase
MEGNKSYVAREMMFGYRDEFEYFECSKCGCLQIKDIPNNLSKYYPPQYYSFQKLCCSRGEFLKLFCERQIVEYCLYGKNPIGALLSTIFGTPSYCNWIKRVGIKFESEILDIGCGTGGLLRRMQRVGFSNLTGIDPYIDNDIFYEGGLKVFKKEIYELEQQFDFIMLNHSFEHMCEPLSVFKELYRLLRPNRYVLIRIPVASSFAWRKYGVNWVQLDAPRHLFLHTTKSIQILADEVGFRLIEIIFDSTEFQFLGSERYLRDIPEIHWRDANSYMRNSGKSIFSKKKIAFFKRMANELNKNHDGDSAWFYLYRI